MEHLYEQLADDLRGLIEGRVLQPGDRLPSVRQLSEQRRLSVSTVLQALRQLEDRGMVEARPQAGYYVRRRSPARAEPQPIERLKRPVYVGVNQLLMQVLQANERPGMLPLGSAYPAPGLLPSARMQRMFAKVARQSRDLLAGGTCTAGNDERLIRQLVRLSLDWGGPFDAEEIIVTNSCTESFNLCLRAVTKPGDTVALESPTYLVLLQIIEDMGLKALEIPTHPRTGLSVEALELATRNGAVKACVLIPNANNPLGCIMPEENKRRVAQLLAERDVPLIEDDIYGDLHFEGSRPWPIKAYDTSGNTMLCSSFSKTISPALRLGFVAAGRRYAELMQVKTLTSGVTGVLQQAALAEFLEGGGYARELRHARRAYAGQVARMADAVAEYFPHDCTMSRPQGGFVFWAELPKQVDALALHKDAVAEGIAFVPGQLFSASGQYRNCLRLNCGNPWNEAIDAGIRRLGELVRQHADAG
ncbi:MAG: PLP-dependent aminotransferase family protein [Gammaproteobacteria bacterium]|nr:PLP-dependent aminotransferase family protein [Gammaproteobacteria bacterium]MBU1414527.1 PLP-dependent aminotransferase family protein [Gammaproteobacteria bacterium]